MERRLTRSAKRKQEASATAVNAGGAAGPSTQAGHSLRNTRSRKAAAEASAKALKAAAPPQTSKPSKPPAVPAKRAADAPVTRARSKRQATGKAAEVPGLKQEEDLPDAPVLPELSAQLEADPDQQEAGPSSAAPSSRMETDGNKGSDQKPAQAAAAAAAAAAQKEADEHVSAKSWVSS